MSAIPGDTAQIVALTTAVTRAWRLVCVCCLSEWSEEDDAAGGSMDGADMAAYWYGWGWRHDARGPVCPPCVREPR